MGCTQGKKKMESLRRESISTVWFGGDLAYWDRNSDHPNPMTTRRWFTSPVGFDEMLKTNFESRLGALNENSPATIDNILLASQVPRKIYKRQAIAYQHDPVA